MLQRSVAAGVLTPPPIDAPTRITPPEAVADSFDDGTEAPTRFVAPAEQAARKEATVEDTGPLTPGKPFGSRYHIIRLLGLGGMGAVYQAWDTELSVAVAIKVIRPEAMNDPAAAREIERRFKRELLLAREVTHKNVVRIHDLGEIDRIKYITMSYIDGMDLASMLKRDRQFPVAQAMVILRSFLPGLVAAHSAGVVHRDLKPANIMLGTRGDALIMDFGIAYSTRDADIGANEIKANLPEELRRAAGHGDGATLAGSVLGTVHYMAPEQARGEQVDQRADVYAVGLILYDMLLGRRRAEKADSAVGELEARMKQAPPSVRSVAPEIPAALDAIVSRCLEPDPGRRFQTTSELAAALDRLDDNGELLPVRRVVGLPLMAATVVILVGLAAGVWYYQRQFIPAPVHDPVSVVIADFQNQTGDVTFDRTLEPMLKRALEGAGFISAYDRSALARTVGARLPETLDQVAAREIAVKEGLGVVLSGVIRTQGAGYGVSVTATQTVTGEVIADVQGRAANKDQVLATATRLVSNVRQALGDETSESAQMFAMASLSATSLDVVREYAAAQDAASRNRFEEAMQSALKAVELDPTFGIGYQLLAVASRNVGRQADAEKYINQALRYLDGMTERERFSTRGMFYRVTGDYQQCVKEYGDLLARYSADVTGHNQLALCASQLRDMNRAMSEMRKVVELLPNRVVFRDNLALYANYAGDFETAETEARTVQEPDAYAQLALAFSQMGQGQLPEASQTYQNLAGIGALGASFSASGLGDLAVFEGRFADAQRILERGAADDLAANNPNRAAAKFAALAYAHILRGQNRPAVAAAQKALTNSSAVKIRFLAARVFIEARDLVSAAPLMTGLAAELQSEPQAYAKLLEGEIALQGKNLREAIRLFTDANTLLDTWIGHFDLGRAYLEGGQLPQADSEFDRCLKRRGEALSLFLDEEPTFGFLPPVYYYQGRVREALQNAGFAEPYRTYLSIRGRAGEDPLLPEVRRRAGN
ncbi:MAG: protein kinase [Vicinamibacterales bacterium]